MGRTQEEHRAHIGLDVLKVTFVMTNGERLFRAKLVKMLRAIAGQYCGIQHV